jgi:aminobenzoyl-glutamate transport protein
MATQNTDETAGRKRGVLDWIEYLGNKLPDPALLFALLAAVVVVLSALGNALEWRVQPIKPIVVTSAQVQADGSTLDVPVLDAKGQPTIRLENNGDPIGARSLLSADGIYWMLSSALRNFAQTPALPIIFTALLGIGLAEKFGFFSAMMRGLAGVTPRALLTPTIVLLGATSSIASDAGYVILPPLAAALYLAMGRHPIAGLAAAFAGVSGGFGAGFFPNGSDGVLTGIAQNAARVIDAGYEVSMLHNYYFKVGSAFTVMLGGWWVTDKIIEPRLNRDHAADKGTPGDNTVQTMRLDASESRALRVSLAVMAACAALWAAMVLIPGMPLYGDGQRSLPNGKVLLEQSYTLQTPGAPAPAGAALLVKDPLQLAAKGSASLVEAPGPRWSHVIVPVIVISFLVPGLVFGWMTGRMKTQADIADALNHGIRGIVPILVMLFFLAQFTAYMNYSQLDRMLAYAGGSVLFEASLPIPILLLAFITVVIFGDFAMSGMLAKFGVLAPIFIPMFMIVGMSPELTTAAYRIGDSVVNIITPLNAYMLIVLAVFQKYRANAGLGTLMALMMPYSIVLALLWSAVLIIWYLTGLPLGPSVPMHFPG